ncbi:Zn-ribbon domain-containing OB-fold protein [Streptomyces purpurogeneiscleroticus]|uniref:Zn-ribbon domain-containing OB-fold protein n=1 Tax=Streptomyces purpurogeneiscleroticus TaxID=68259 RepID=UPI001CBCFF5E|nr:hypothetical protein [Streptomyces purpurogeneiscleroticus]MBZ4014456.1 hypothetical protein [Streptomyces purpurogeneiscleroticus]
MSHSVIETAANAPVEGEGVSRSAPQSEPDAQAGIRDGVLHFQRCRWCHTSAFRRLLCPACGSTDLAGERSSGIGVIRHVTVVGRGEGRPRAMAVIDMHEGFCLRARVSAVPLDSARVGALVRLASGPRPREIVFQLCDL